VINFATDHGSVRPRFTLINIAAIGGRAAGSEILDAVLFETTRFIAFLLPL
jgi:hypothetical protein